MKVLVTGGSGIVGHYVIDELYRSGSHEIVNADLVRMGDMSHSGTIGASAGDRCCFEGRLARFADLF